MTVPFEPPSIVVGIDGSRAAARAALWALDEAIGRGLELRLVAAAETDQDTDSAQSALRTAVSALESAGRPGLPGIRTEVVAAGPVVALLEAGRTAAMICLGAVGRRHFEHNRLGSTVNALVASAHCPVAVVRGGDRAASGWVVVELDRNPDSAGVLQFAVEEARMRTAPLRVLGTWADDAHGPHSSAESDHLVRIQLDRRLETWRHRYPDLDVAPVAVRGSALSYLHEHRNAVQLVVVGVRNSGGVAELLGPAGHAALHDTDCSIVLVDHQRLL